MRIRLGTVSVDERTRRAIAHAHGEDRKASRAECRVFLLQHSAAELAGILDDFDALTEPKLPFEPTAPARHHTPLPEVGADAPHSIG